MIDLHCHVDLYPKPMEVVSKVAALNIFVLSVTTTPSAWPGTSALAKSSPMIKTALGLHPQLASERMRELKLFDQYLSETDWVGEVGLDGSPELRNSWDDQVKVFQHILESCSRAGGRILSIHSRRASDQVISALRSAPDAGVPVLHWFSGSKKSLESAIDFGCWFSVGWPMLSSQKGLELVERMPRDRVLTETDGPFAEFEGKPASPWNIGSAVTALARIWKLDVAATESQLCENLERLRKTLGSSSDKGSS